MILTRTMERRHQVGLDPYDRLFPNQDTMPRGGFGNLMMMSQAGFMTFDETLASMKLFSEEVYPRLKELTASYDAGEMQEIKAALPDVENIDVSALASEFVR